MYLPFACAKEIWIRLGSGFVWGQESGMTREQDVWVFLVPVCRSDSLGLKAVRTPVGGGKTSPPRRNAQGP